MLNAAALHIASRTAALSRRVLLGALLLLGIATPATLWLSAAPASAATCDFVAAPSGSDGASGSAAAPFRSVQHLVAKLSSGATGCLRAGSYPEDVTFSHGGGAGAPITLTSFPGDPQAKITGRMWLPHGSDYITVSNLRLNGTNASDLPSPTVDDAHARFVGNDITDNHTAICFDLGDDTGRYGRAADVLIQDNRIHDCGVMPARNHDHGIYVEAVDNVQILHNTIVNNSDRGIQLYPDSQGATIKYNVIDSNGEGIIFSGDFGVASSNNDVEYNVITNSKVRNNVESWYPGGNPVGHANVLANNCVHGGVDDHGNGGLDTSGGGFVAARNVIADPHYVNRGAGDYTVRQSSPCAAILAGAAPPARAKVTSQRHQLGAPSSVPGRAPLALVARIARGGHRVLVRGRLASHLLSQPRLVVVEVRVGNRWRVRAHRVLSRRSTFTLMSHMTRSLGKRTSVRASVAGIPGNVTVLAQAS